MEIALYDQYLIGFFVIALVFGAVANKSNFCTMGAVSDWVNFGDLNRMRAWVLAMAVAILGVGILEYIGLIDMSLTSSNETSTPPYRFANFVWLRYLLGGLIFGVGMTLASGCGNKTLVRIGEGNLKSLVVLLMIMSGASLMFFTNFDYFVFLQWMDPLSIDFAQSGASGQDIASIAALISGVENSAIIALTAALLTSGLMLVWVVVSADFRDQTLLITSGLIIGALVLFGWYLTAGEQGQKLLEEIDFMDEPVFASGAQSMTFIGPNAHVAQYFYQGFAKPYLSLGVVLIAGVVFGSLLYTLIYRRIRFEWFIAWDDFFRHAMGGFLMGIGGVLAMGCTIGQGITGVSTLALGSFTAVVSIILASSMTMKYQYYRMLYEDSAATDVLITILVDMRFLPGNLRRLKNI